MFTSLNPFDQLESPFMSFFSSKPKYVPKVGDLVLARDKFKNVARTQPFFRRYSTAVGVAPAAQALDDGFTQNLKSTAAPGYWSYGSSANFGNPSALKFQDEASFTTFMDSLAMIFGFDVEKIDSRTRYIRSLKGKADEGLLYTDLQTNFEPEATYYHAPAPVVPKPGAPAIPPKPANMVNQSKALAWLTHGVHGDTKAFTKTLMQMSKFDGTFPLGADSTSLFTAWNDLVPIAPAYRGWTNTASIQKYPSNIGGKKVLDDAIKALNLTAMPARGDNKWYDLALYMMGTIITTQAFTDGNKRMSRLAYVLMLLSGGVPIVVPNGVLVGRLGDMM